MKNMKAFIIILCMVMALLMTFTIVGCNGGNNNGSNNGNNNNSGNGNNNGSTNKPSTENNNGSTNKPNTENNNGSTNKPSTESKPGKGENSNLPNTGGTPMAIPVKAECPNASEKNAILRVTIIVPIKPNKGAIIKIAANANFIKSNCSHEKK